MTPPTSRDEPGERMSETLHSVTITFEQGDYWPTLRFTCQAPAGADCRTVCSNSECEEGCYSPGEPKRERVPVDYCNTVEWFENGDDVAGDIFGGPTSITAPVLVDWSRGEDGPEWRLAPISPDSTKETET
jgi:hypothetical protein